MSLSRSEQARINGAKSRGPRTPEGKARSSMNALKHGRRSRLAHAPSLPAFQSALDAALAHFAPRSTAESALVHQFAFSDAQLDLWRSIETALLDRISLATAPPPAGPGPWAAFTAALESHVNQSPLLPFVVRRIARFAAARNRAFRHLASLQSARLAAEPFAPGPDVRPADFLFSPIPLQNPSQPAQPKPLRPIPPVPGERR
jgi:hypothetical protein